MLWVLKRTVSMRQFFLAPKMYVKIDGSENIHNFTLKIFVYLILQQTTYSRYLSWFSRKIRLNISFELSAIFYWQTIRQFTWKKIKPYFCKCLLQISSCPLWDKATVMLNFWADKKANKWATTWDFQQCGLCDQQSLRSACTYTQSDQSLC